MKFLITGDWHLTDKRPRCRIDDYRQAQKDKIDFIIKKHIELETTSILQPGDLTDKFEFRDSFKTKWIRRLNKADMIITIPGQHDLRYHTSDINNTPLGVLKEGARLKVAHHNPLELGGRWQGDFHIYGAAWGKPIPKVLDEKAYNILLVHKMIVMEKLWEEQEDYEIAGTFLRRNKFDLIVSGDNHNSFEIEYNGKFLFNCGSLMRSTIDQKDHRPIVHIFDTARKVYDTICVPIKPFSEVADLKVEEQIKERNKKLDDLAALLKTSMSADKKKRMNYKARVEERVRQLKRKNAISEETESIISEVMES